MSATPFTAYCPTCKGRRTYNLSAALDVPRCVVCGDPCFVDARPLGAAPEALAREAVVAMNDALDRLDAASAAVHRAARDDRETIGELAGAVARHDDELGEIRDSLVELTRAVGAIARDLERLHAADTTPDAA